MRFIFIFLFISTTLAYAERDSLGTMQRQNSILARKEIKKPLVRPFITDDARVVGARLSQLETWARYEHRNFQQWVMLAYGPTKRTELTLGGVGGYDEEEGEGHFAYALPLLQAKILFREYKPNKLAGVGLVAGSFLPVGSGTFRPPGYGIFSFLTISQALGHGEKLLLHLNAGGNYLYEDNHQFIGTWGFGSQIKTIGGFHLVAELFSGDPYVPGTGTAYQAGFRHFFSDNFQIDMTFGEGLAGRTIMPFWVSAGLRLVFGTNKSDS
ncbi:MAG: hypothetical protein ACK40G_03495 [Cytophagaceae bacterium]